MLLGLAVSWFTIVAAGAQAAPTDDASAANEPADERERDSANGEAPDEAQEANEAEETTKDGAAKPAKEVFTPSEEISEDLAVPFPVDI